MTGIDEKLKLPTFFCQNRCCFWFNGSRWHLDSLIFLQDGWDGRGLVFGDANLTAVREEVTNVCASDLVFVERLNKRRLSWLALAFLRIDGDQTVVRHQPVALAVRNIMRRIFLAVLNVSIAAESNAVFL